MRRRATMSNGIVFVISGPSGSGKGTVLKVLREMYDNFAVSVSATTRAPREGEREGVEYFFKTRDEFESLIKNEEVLEYTVYNGNYYGTLKSEAERISASGKDLILEIEVDGGSQVKKLLGERCVTIILTAPCPKEQERRLRDRGTESEEVIARRLARAREEMLEVPKYDYVVINETGKTEECAANVLAIIKAEHLRASRVPDCIKEFFK